MRALTLMAAVLVLAGCGSSTGSSDARLLGSYDLALVDHYVFVTSSNNDELRVLDVTPPATTGFLRMYVRAPNPLKALGISVLPRPTSLTADHLRGDDGSWTAGGYVFATSAGAAAISIVGAKPEELIELKRLPVVGPVTAVSALTQADGTHLYFATFDGVTGVLYQTLLPDSAGLRAMSDADVVALPQPVLTLPGRSISALLALPPMAERTVDGGPFCATGGPCVVIAARAPQGAAGETVLLDPSTLQAVPLAFPGPVKRLTTHGSLVVPTTLAATDTRTLDAGERVFALLDEEACGGSAECGGVLAVDTRAATGAAGFGVAKDIFGQPMLPIRPASGLVQGLAIGLHPLLYVPATKSVDKKEGIASLDAAGMITSSNGELQFFDAAQLRAIDWNADPTKVVDWYLRNADGSTPETQVQGPVLDAEQDVLSIADGALDTQSLVISWRGPVPGLNRLPTTPADGATLPVPVEVAGRAAVGDAVQFFSGSVACGLAEVTAVASNALTVDAVPTECATSRDAFTVHAGTANGYVVQSTELGYLGRGAPGGQLAYTAPQPVFRPDSFVAGAPSLLIHFLADPPQVSDGAFWTVAIDAKVQRYRAVLADYSDTAAGLGCFTQLPGPAVWDDVRNHVFSAFPSANGLIDVDPTLAYPTVLGTGNGARCYR